MGNIIVRMGVVIGTLLAVQLGFLYVGVLRHPTVVEPQRPITDFPMVVKAWEGKPAKLDEREFAESEVASDVSRIYAKEGRTLKFFLAEYDEPAKGLYHNPMNCYHSNGFSQVGSVEWQPVKTSNRPDTKISVTTWTRNSEKVMVAYWYEVGDHTMYERQDLWGTQWAMFGKTKWPVMFKVLLEMPANNDPEQAKGELLEMARVVREWLGSVQPKLD